MPVLLDIGLLWSSEQLAQARCRDGNNPDLFFPPEGTSATEIMLITNHAKRICTGDPKRSIPACPILYACREKALAQPDLIDRVYGVLDPDQIKEEANRRDVHAAKLKEIEARSPKPPTAPASSHIPTPPRPEAPAIPGYRQPTRKPKALGKPRLQLLLEHLGQTEGSVTVWGQTELNQLARAIGYPNWNAAQSFIGVLRDEDIVEYHFFDQTLIVHCGAAKKKLTDKIRRDLLPDKMWLPKEDNPKSEPQPPAPPEYAHLVHDEDGYIPPRMYQTGSVSHGVMAEVLGRIVAAGGELRGYSFEELAHELNLSPTAVSRVFQMLDAGRYVQRSKDARRKTRYRTPVRLTATGVYWLLEHRPDLIEPAARRSALSENPISAVCATS